MKEIKQHVEQIVETIESGYMYCESCGNIEDIESDHDVCPDCGEEIREASGFDYLEDVLDIEYIISGDKQYLGARVLVAFGGPNIWINTRTKQVEGYWWDDNCIMSYSNDAMDLDGTIAELWEC